MVINLGKGLFSDIISSRVAKWGFRFKKLEKSFTGY
jgi:hypothetical protein